MEAYKVLIISTIVDIKLPSRSLSNAYKVLIISTIVDRKSVICPHSVPIRY